MEARAAVELDWRDAAAYAPLLCADRSLFAWEWLRRDAGYRRAARHCASTGVPRRPAAAAFGLVRFEPPELAVPRARPLWRMDFHPQVLAVERGSVLGSSDAFELGRLREFVTFVVDGGRDHLLLSDGLRTIRLDAPRGTFADTPTCLRYRIEGLAAAGPLVLTLQRFLALCRSGGFSRLLHPPETRAKRWILVLRAWDAIRAGADQREIAEFLLAGAARAPRWRILEPSLRSRAQRLVRSARAYGAGAFRTFVSGAMDLREPNRGL